MRSNLGLMTSMSLPSGSQWCLAFHVLDMSWVRANCAMSEVTSEVTAEGIGQC